MANACFTRCSWLISVEPMACCLINAMISAAISVYLSFNFKDIDEKQRIDKNKVYKKCKDLFASFKLFTKSQRLKNLIFFGAIVSAIILSLSMLRSSIMQDIGIPAEYFGIIFAVLEIISGISAKNANKFHEKYRNKTLASLAIPLVFSCIFLGVICSVNIGFVVNVVVILIVFLIQYITKGPFYTLIKQYLNNFTTTSLRNKISSSFNLLENILRFLITFIASALLRVTTTATTFTIIGCVLSIIVVLMLDNMRKKVGLKPEQYSDKDINILELK